MPRQQRLASRSFPYGEVTDCGFVGAQMPGDSQTGLRLSKQVGYQTWEPLPIPSIYLKEPYDRDPSNYRAIIDLVDELHVLRKLVVELLRRVGPKIVDWNEYHRGIVSTANKIGEHPDDIHAIVDPIMRRLSSEMLDQPPQTETGKRRGHPDDDKRGFISRNRGPGDRTQRVARLIPSGS